MRKPHWISQYYYLKHLNQVLATFYFIPLILSKLNLCNCKHHDYPFSISFSLIFLMQVVL